jgi:hypothetical protein
LGAVLGKRILNGEIVHKAEGVNWPDAKSGPERQSVVERYRVVGEIQSCRYGPARTSCDTRPMESGQLPNGPVLICDRPIKAASRTKGS